MPGPRFTFHRFLLVCLAGVLVGTISTAHSQSSPGKSAKVPASGGKAKPTHPDDGLAFIKGGNVSAWNITDLDRVFADAKRLELNTITLTVRIDMASAKSSQVQIDPLSLAFAKKAMALHPTFRYIVEPYPWIDQGNTAETELDPTDRAEWFTSYQAALVELGRQFPKAWGMYVASNLVKIEQESERWIALVRKVRTTFPGQLIYRTQWWVTAAWEPKTLEAYQAKLANPIFGEVDVIGIASYFELSDEPAPTSAQIKEALHGTTVFQRGQDVYAEVMALNARWHKPLLLGELSCPALDLGAQSPWDPRASQTPNPEIQKNYLSAYLETFPSDPAQFLGFSLFVIGHPTATTYDLAPSAAEYIRAFSPARPKPLPAH